MDQEPRRYDVHPGRNRLDERPVPPRRTRPRALPAHAGPRPAHRHARRGGPAVPLAHPSGAEGRALKSPAAMFAAIGLALTLLWTGPLRADTATGGDSATSAGSTAVAGSTTSASADIPLPPADMPLRPADGVKDPVFAVLLGFVLDNHEGDLDSTRVRAEVEKIGRKPKLPYKWIEVITRNRTAVSPTVTQFDVSSVFDRVIDVPVPYQILGYHPGSFRGSSRLDFREMDLGTRHISNLVKQNDRVVSTLFSIDDVRLYILEGGMLEIDIDGWLDRLAGPKLDDTRVAGLVVFRKDGALYGMALGYNPDGEPRSGTISFGEDKILYPNPPELKAVARQIRSEMETYAPTLAAKYRGWK